EEVRSAHLLLHVVDGSDPHAGEQQIVVDRVLGELGVNQTPRITVFNKSDASTVPGLVADGPTCHVSARTGANIPQLVRQIGTLLASQQERLEISVPIARGDVLAELHRAGRIADQTLDGDAFRVVAYVPPQIAGRVRKSLAVSQRGRLSTHTSRRTGRGN